MHDLLLILRAEVADAVLDDIKPGEIVGGQVDHRPIGAEDDPVGSETVEHVLDVWAQFIPVPVLVVGFRSYAGELAVDIRAAGQLAQLILPRLGDTGCDARFADVVEQEGDIRALRHQFEHVPSCGW